MQSRVVSSKPLISIFSLRRIFYLLAFSPYLLLYLSVFLGQQSEFQNLWMLFPCAVIFIIIPLLDRLIGLDNANPDENQKQSEQRVLVYDASYAGASSTGVYLDLGY